jgi:hypothetical protein
MALKAVGAEEITVSSTAIGITSSLVTSAVHMAVVQHDSGGDVLELVSGTAAQADSQGEFKRSTGSVWEVWGEPDLSAINWIKKSGVSDATLKVQTFGSGD